MSPPGATPPGKGEASGGSGGGSAGRGAARGGGNALSVIDFREDMFPAAVTLVFLLLGLLKCPGCDATVLRELITSEMGLGADAGEARHSDS
eukprot:CAMPEP_0177794044 /NCGR_PEP_ID=MMETSP0491_2-20121128/25420_1 /TAXON_ID=63592 /ORGANISM="Tetraselmis chuii, Strain PLY429" /LENGTH=91 /DNA_ID=CAMNT_0019316643 /DNA_START=960 /DNA_END=1233 /DNA_ORIENTATION=+